MTRLRNRIFKLLTLLYPPADIDAARWTLEHGDARGRSSASEYLDNILSSPLRKQVLPVLEDMPREERVRRGNVLLKTRPRDVEETLLQLINDDDPVTAAAAIDVVRDAEDVEPRRRRRARARASGREGLVRVRGRVVGAGRAAHAGRAPARAVARAAAGRRAGRAPAAAAALCVGVGRRAVPDGERVAAGPSRAGERPGAGRIGALEHSHPARRTRDRGRDATRAPSTVDAPAALGFVEAMAGLAMPETIRTSGLGGDARADRRGAADAPRRQHRSRQRSLRHAGGTVGRTRTTRCTPPRPRASSSSSRTAGSRRSTASSRCSTCRSSGACPPTRCSNVAMVAAPVKMTAGSVLFPESAPPALWLLLTGEVVLESSTGQPPVTARGGDIIGSVSTMAGRSLGRSAKVVTDGIALKIDREDLFDVLGERPDLLRQMFASMFKRERPLTRDALGRAATSPPRRPGPCGRAPAGRAGCCTTACARRWASRTRRRRGSAVLAGFSRKAWTKTTS